VVERFAADCGFSLSESRFLGRFGQGVVDATDENVGATPVAVLAPQTFMNRSGESVAQALAVLPVEDQATDLIVVFDDVDLPLGRLRIRPRGSSGGHRGVANVIDCVGHGDFPRLRFGIGRSAEPTATTVDWVLQDFSDLEESVLHPSAERAAEALTTMVLLGVTPTMNRYNRDPDTGEERSAEAGGRE